MELVGLELEGLMEPGGSSIASPISSVSSSVSESFINCGFGFFYFFDPFFELTG
jgi:hypothetical protein